MIKQTAVVLCLLLLAACSDDSDEKAFRANLIDKALNDENKKMGDAFLAENKQKEGVVTLPSGLQYKIIETGSGRSPRLQDNVEVYYSGSLVTGEVFDSSEKRGKSSVFPLKSVVPGWRKALVKMKIGDKWRIYLPSELAYGARSPSELIAANSALIYDIKLIAVVDGQSEKKTNDQ